MPPKKKNLPAASSPFIQANKRTGESLFSGLAKRQKHADDANPNEKRIMDSYCWICHQPGKDISCKDCQRVYHSLCLDKVHSEFSNDTCPECQLKLLDNGSRFLIDKFREILTVAATEFRKKFRSPDKMMFFQWPNIEDSELVRIIDFDLLEDNIKDENNPYRNLAEIISDIKWIHHNYCILDGVDSPTAKEADGFVRMFQKEIADIEDCPKCYYHMFVERRKDDFFVKICDPPHDIVWAWLKGSSPWPAKCLRIENGKAHVRFFGTHDKSNIAIGNKKCLSISLHHPTHKNSKLTDENLVPKKKEYKIAVNELLVYIDRFERKFGKKFKYYEKGTPYKCEATKPTRKKRNKDRRNVSTARNITNLEDPEESILLPPPPSESVLNVSEDSQSYSSSQVEADMTTSFKSVETVQEDYIINFDILDTTGLDDFPSESVVHTSESIITEDFSEDNCPIPSSSPVVTASMVCEVAGYDDTQTAYNHLFSTPAVYSRRNSHADTILSQSNFQPLASCSSTPLAPPSTSNPWNTICISHSHNLLSDSAPASPQEEFPTDMYSEPSQVHSDSGDLPASNVPFDNASTSVSASIDNDDEVIFLSSSRPSQNSNLNPSAVLPYIFSGSPTLQSLFRDGRYVFDSLFIRCWAYANCLPQAPELITRLAAEIKRLKSEKKRLQREKEALEHKDRIDGNRVLRQKVAILDDENSSLKMRLEEKKKRILTLEEFNQAAIRNAATVCRGLHRTYQRKFEGADLSLLNAKEEQLCATREELRQKTDELEVSLVELQHLDGDLKGKETLIEELRGSLAQFKAEAADLRAKNEEAKETYMAKLEELVKLQREKMSWETKQEVKGMVNKHLIDLGLTQIQKPSSSAAEFHEQVLPANVYNNTSGSSKKSSRSSSTKSQDTYPRRRSNEAVEAALTDEQFCHQVISEQGHVKTIARKTTSVNIQLEHSKTITTTRNEGNIIGLHRPPALYGSHYPTTTPAILYPIMAPIVPYGAAFGLGFPHPDSLPKVNNTAYDLSQHIAHRERYHSHSPSNIAPPAHGRDRHFKDSRKRQSRYPHHDLI